MESSLETIFRTRLLKIIHTAASLELAIDKSISQLHWAPQWGIETCIEKTIDWYKAHNRANTDMLAQCQKNIAAFSEIKEV